jgi:hemerythrin-like domain-containing protein
MPEQRPMHPFGRARPRTTDDADDFVQLLLDCHGRIRHFAALARVLGETPALSADAVRDAAFRVRRYFGEALPLHVEDEEESVLPRLLGREPALDEALERMSAEHAAHAPLLAEVLRCCRELERAPERHEALRAGLARDAVALEREFATHLETEEALILPAIGRLLDADVRAALVRELRARRARQW